MRLNAGPEAFAAYVSGGSEGIMSFLYTVSLGDRSRHLDTDGENSLAIPDGASMVVSDSGMLHFT